MWKWTEHTSEVEGEAPSPRYGHCALALPDDRHLATFGGCDARQDMFFSSVAMLDTLTWRWSTPKTQVGLPACLHIRLGARTVLTRICADATAQVKVSPLLTKSSCSCNCTHATAQASVFNQWVQLRRSPISTPRSAVLRSEAICFQKL